jgi:hypothetical protein
MPSKCIVSESDYREHWAVSSRVLQFKAGPNENRFTACAEHRPLLEGPWPSIGGGLFFSTSDEPIREVDPNDEESCDGCREGGL